MKFYYDVNDKFLQLKTLRQNTSRLTTNLKYIPLDIWTKLNEKSYFSSFHNIYVILRSVCMFLWTEFCSAWLYHIGLNFMDVANCSIHTTTEQN